MIATRRLQQHFADGLIAAAIDDLWEPWMRHADSALEDDALLFIIRPTALYWAMAYAC